MASGWGTLQALFHALFTICVLGQGVPQSEIAALQVFFNSFNGPRWTPPQTVVVGRRVVPSANVGRPSWTFQQTNNVFTSDPCRQNWVGITCTASNIIAINITGFAARSVIPSSIGMLSSLSMLTGLDLGSNSIRGPIVSQIGLLTSLQSLVISQNSLTGTIASSLYNLRGLTFLNLGVNALGGSISTLIGQLSNLQKLWVNLNKLTGTIPSELFQLPRINNVALTTNRIQGTIPQNVGQPGARMAQLNLDSLSLTGTLPTGLGALVGVTSLRLFPGNFWTGTLPSELGQLGRLQSILIQGTRLGGTIPNTFGGLTSLTSFILSNSIITGSIPPSLGSLRNLQQFAIQNCSISGPIPNSLGSIPGLRLILLESNSLTSTIPPSIFQRNLLQLSLRGNRLTGPIPSTMGLSVNLRAVRFDSNRLSSSIPSSVGGLSGLTWFHAGDNRISGSIPSAVWQMMSLRNLDLSINRITGTVATSIGNLASLTYVSIAGNSLSGSLPSELGRLRALTYLAVTGNSLNGQLPSQLGLLINLQTLLLNLCFFTGTVPPQLSQLTRLTELDLEGNVNNRGRRSKISGTLPTALSSLTGLMNFSVGHQNLQGCLPNFVSSFTRLVSLKFHSNAFVCSIPASWSSLQLSELFLFENSLSGTLPSFLGAMTRMKSLLLFSNNLRGTIPQSYGQLTNLEILSMASNSLVGQVPAGLSALTKLRVLMLRTNRLTGSLGAWLGNWPFLVGLDLQSNLFSSSLPAALTRLLSLQLLALQNNRITGTIPAAMSQLRNLSLWNASSNFLSGALPSSVGTSLTQLAYFDLSANSLTSTLPASFAGLRSLRYLFIESNALTGPIPTAWGVGSLRNMQQIRLCNNRLTGGVPSQLGTGLSSLQKLYLSNNTQLGGTIPAELGLITGLEDLFLDRTGLRGSLPAALCSSWSRLSKLRLGSNSLTGPLPSTLAQMTSLASLQLQSNAFSGPLLADWSPLTRLARLHIANNALKGPVPSSLGRLARLAFLSIASNLLTGTLPSQLSQLSALTYIDVHNNSMLSSDSSLGLEFFNAANTPLLQFFDASSNNFSGPVPSKLFTIPSLRTVALARNCFQGALPSTICQSTALQDLVFDGLAAGDGCQKPLWPKNNSLGFDASLAKKMKGSLPPCLLRMPKIGLLHLAGNGLSGFIDPQLTSWPANLSDLTLSNNKLSQPIPAPLQQQAWRLSKLDLSFNKFNGTLSQMQPPSSLLNLVVNRFSGALSSALINKPPKPMSFSILSGNAFDCADKKTGLPQFDPNIQNVQCGSDKMNSFLYVLLTLLCVVGAWRLVKGRQLQGGAEEEKADALDTLPGIKKVLTLLTEASKLLLVLLALSLLLLLPIYAVLTSSAESQSESYVWTVSAAYKSGSGAATGMFVLFTAVAVAAFALILKHQAFSLRPCGGGGKEPLSAEQEAEAEEDGEWEDVHDQKADVQDHYQHQQTWSDDAVLAVLVVRLTLIFLVNVIVTFTLNVGFVFIMRSATQEQQTLAQLGMSVLNAAWGKVVALLLSTKLLYLGLHDRDIAPAARRKPLISSFKEGEAFTASLAMFTNLVAPMVASMAASPNCFLALFYRGDPVESTYFATTSYAESLDSMSLQLNPSNANLSFVNVSSSARVSETVTNQVSFSAPFQYLYQCSSAVLSAYAPVMLTSAFVRAFAAPALVYITRKILLDGKVPAYLYAIFVQLLPKLALTRRERKAEVEKVVASLRLQDLEKDRVVLSRHAFRKKHKAELDEARQLWSRNDFFVDLITDLALLLSFGVACPPLGVALIISILSSVLLQRHLISAFVAYTSVPNRLKGDESKIQAIIDADAVNAGDVRELLRLEKDVKFDTEGTPVFYARWMLLLLSTTFLSFFVFDTAGDQQGAKGAAWAPVAQTLVPLALAAVLEFVFRSKFVSFCRTHADAASQEGFTAETTKTDLQRRGSDVRRRSGGNLSFQGTNPGLELTTLQPQPQRASIRFSFSKGDAAARRLSASGRLSLSLPMAAAPPTGRASFDVRPPSLAADDRRRDSSSWVGARLAAQL